MRPRCAMALMVLFGATGAFAQSPTTLNLSTQGHNPDFANFPFTRPISVGSAMPPTCQVGQLFFNSAAGAGQNVYACTQTNTWGVVGGSPLQPAGPNTLGGVFVPGNSFLSVDPTGVLSANVGTTAGTLAAGNDTRIVNALQPTSLIPAANILGLAASATTDSTNASNISKGTLSLSLFPQTINSSTSGNAATASALAVTPKACGSGLFSIGISAAGNANCAQVVYSQLAGAPALYNQILQSGGKALTQRTNLNFAAGSNVTVTPSDNGTNTTTLTISSTGLQAPATANSIVKFSSGTATTAAQAADIIATLGFTPQSTTALNSPNGYAGLDANGFLLQTEIPATINSNTSGRAATAAALAATPATCAANQFAQGIAANGNAICATPNSTSGLPDPGANGLVKRTASNADSIAAAGVDYYAPGQQINSRDIPSVISSSTTGNSATTNAFGVTPAACPAGQYAQGIAANGNAICGTPVGTGGLPDPGSNGLVKRTATSTDTAAVPGVDYYAPGTQIQTTDLPPTLSSSTTGNAATATAFATLPAGCPGGQFATGIAANGQAICGTPASTAGGARTGTALPAAATCSASTLGSLYIQTGSFQRFFGCQYNGSSYVWWPMNPNQLNVMGFGCKADDVTDDSGCINTAIQTAQVLNSYSGTVHGSEVYFPNGRYKVSNPIVLPRTGVFASASSTNLAAAVSLVGEHMTSTILDGQSITTGDVIMWQPCTLSGTPPACTSSTGRTQGERIVNFTIYPPNSLGPNGTGLGAIHYAYTRHSTGETGCYNGVTAATDTICTDEKLRNVIFENLFFYGSNVYNPYEIYIEGDCNNCTFRNVWADPSIGSTSAPLNTILIRTDVCIGGGLAQDNCGLNYSIVEDAGLKLSRGGFGSVFQGSFNQSFMRKTYAGGVWGGVANDPTSGVGGSYGYQFINSLGSTLETILCEGGAGIQVQLTNSRQMHFTNMQVGSPYATSVPGSSPMGDGIHLTNSSENTFDGYGHPSPFNSWSSKSSGANFMINVDANSRNNLFLKMEASGPSDINIADLSSNFVQWCDMSGSTPTAQCGAPGLPPSGTPAGTPWTSSAGTWATLGYMPGYPANSGAATISTGPAAGNSPSIALGSGSGSMRGTITLTEGTSPSASAAVATVTFANGFPSAPVCELLPNNSASAALTGTALVYGANESAGSATNPGTFQLMVGSTPLNAGTTYAWKYQCLR